MLRIPQDAVDLFDTILPEAIARHPDRARALDTVLCFKIEGAGDWTIDCSREVPSPSCSRGVASSSQCTVELDSKHFQEMLLNPNVGMDLYRQRRLRISGDPEHAMKISAVFALVTV